MKFNRFTGWLGAVLLAFGLLGGLLLGGATNWLVFVGQPLVALHVLGGLFFLVYWFVVVGSRQLNTAGSAFKGRGARFGYNFALYAIVFVGLLAVANYFTAENNKRWDLTDSNVYSLASQSERVVQSLRQPLKIVALIRIEGRDDEETKNLLELYKYHAPQKLSLEYLDPRARPELVDRYEMKAGNLLYLEYGSGETKAVSRLNEVTEEALTNAIVKLERGAAKKIYYVEGHEEPGLQDTKAGGIARLAQSIADEQLTIEALLLARSQSVPSDAAAVVLMSPKRTLLPQERQMLIDYAEAGGRLVLLSDPRTTDDVAQIANHFGITVGNNVVIDKIERLYAAPALGAEPIVQTYGFHPITRDLEKKVTIYNIASTVSAQEKTDGVTSITELIKTSTSSWSETSLGLLFDSPEPQAVLDGEDKQGPLSLAVAYEKKHGAKKEDTEKEGTEGKSDATSPASDSSDKVTRVVVIGDSDWILNANLNVYANRDLFLNIVNWAVGEESAISIRPRTMRAQTTPLPEKNLLIILASSLVVPELLLLFGLAVWWRRKTVLA